MSDYFYITLQATGKNHIHSGRCKIFSCATSTRLLGLFENIKLAEQEAKRKKHERLNLCNCKYCRHK